MINITGAGKSSKYDRERRWAQQALECYGINDADVAIIGRPRNKISNLPLRVTQRETGEKYLLTFHNPGEHNTSGVLSSKMQWLSALTQSPVTAPEPIVNNSGSLVTEFDNDVWSCTLVRWVEGRMLEVIGLKNARALGVAMARLHSHSAKWQTPPGFQLPAYDRDRIQSVLTPLKSGIEAGKITAYAYGVFERFMDHLHGVLQNMDKSPDAWGIIHADLHEENRIFYRNEARPIDFSSCGFGYYLYDIAGAQMGLYPWERLAFFEGYASERTLPSDHVELVATFITAHVIENGYYHGFISGEQDDPAKGFDNLAKSLERTYLTPGATVDPDILDEYVGKYELAKGQTQNEVHTDGFDITITREADRLNGQRRTWPKYRLRALENGEFIQKDWGWRYRFNRDEKGNVVSFTHSDDYTYIKQ